MKILIISGNHPRHLFVHQAILESGVECAAIVMEREALMPLPPIGIIDQDRNFFIRHFEERNKIETKIFGKLEPISLFNKISTYFCKPEFLNSQDTANFAQDFGADLAFIFGPDLIKSPLMDVLPDDRVNLHLGLSPWYRGSETLFWPFYFLQPQYAGATFHQILAEADAGAILHHTVPLLQKGDGIHDVGARVVIQAKKDLSCLLKKYLIEGYWSYSEQLSSGKLFLTSDFNPAHLRIIYETFQNRIVDSYLNGDLEMRKPKLISRL